MNINTILSGVFALVASSSVQAASIDGPSVTLPLDQYLEMKKQLEVPSITTLEEVSFQGDAKEFQKITISFSGASQGKPSSIEVLQKSPDFNLQNCSGAAILKLEGNRISLVPRAARYDFKCQIIAKNKAELELTILNALFVRNEVKGVELIVKNDNTEARQIVLARSDRAMDPTAVNSPVSASVYYKLSVLPDDTRLEYQFHFFNPNRTTKNIDLQLRNGETIQEFRTSIPHEEAKGLVKLKLNPGENILTILGKFTGVRFLPLIASSQQYLLIETHPLLKLSFQTKSRRISPDESRMHSQFSGALAFFLRSEDQFTWSTQKLVVFETQGYTVPSASYLYYLPKEGNGIIEASFNIQNQGVPDLSFDVPGKVTYLEIDGMAQALYKDEQGRLLVHMPNGMHHLLVQYRPQDLKARPWMNLHGSFIKPDSTITQVHMRFQVAQKWALLWGQALSDWKSLWNWGIFIWSFLLLMMYGAFFGKVREMGRIQAILCTVTPVLVFLLIPSILPLLIFLWILGLIVKKANVLWGWFGATRIRTVVGVVASVVAAVVIVVFLSSGLMTMKQSTMYSNDYRAASRTATGSGINQMNEKHKMNVGALSKDEGVTASPESNLPEPEDTGSAGGFQGIPARIRIPTDGASTYFSQNLLEKEQPSKFHLILLDMCWIEYLVIAFGVLSLLSLIHRRSKIWEYFKTT